MLVLPNLVSLVLELDGRQHSGSFDHLEHAPQLTHLVIISRYAAPFVAACIPEKSWRPWRFTTSSITLTLDGWAETSGFTQLPRLFLKYSVAACVAKKKKVIAA